MGTFRVECEITNHQDRSRSVRIESVLVDTGSEYTWISEKTLSSIGVLAEKKDVAFVMANGKTITRRVGFAIIRVQDEFTIDEVVLGQEGDLQILGSRTLEGLNLRVDARGKKLVAGGSLPAAAA